MLDTVQAGPAQARHAQIVAELAATGLVLPGAIVQRRTRCQNPGCHCRADPPQLHGPYPTWNRRAGTKTITRTLSPDQVARYRPLFEADRRLRALVAELEHLSILIVTADEDH
jgi:hypothetical protein